MAASIHPAALRVRAWTVRCVRVSAQACSPLNAGSRVCSTAAAPTTGCPAEPSSSSSVKIRSRAGPPARSTSVTNAVSNWRTSRVTSCITAAGRLAAFSTTTRPLPRNARRLKTSTCRYSRSSMTTSLTRAAVAGPPGQ